MINIIFNIIESVIDGFLFKKSCGGIVHQCDKFPTILKPGNIYFLNGQEEKLRCFLDKKLSCIVCFNQECSCKPQ